MSWTQQLSFPQKVCLHSKWGLKSIWNIYCFATNQMQDETAKGNHQATTWISHDWTQLKQQADFFFCDKSSILYCFQIMLRFFLFQPMHKQRIDMNDILQESVVELSRQVQTLLARQHFWEQKKLYSLNFYFSVHGFCSCLNKK